MLTREMRGIIQKAHRNGWVMEPDAKRLLSLAGLPVPRCRVAATEAEAADAANTIGYPLVAKVVSTAVVHKSDVKGVEVGIQNLSTLKAAYKRLAKINGFAGMLVEEQLPGIELIVGAKIDEQFGPVVLLGIGGTGVEIYQDTAVRMAPISAKDVRAMVDRLKGAALIKGHRGASGVDIGALTDLMLKFSDLVMAIRDAIDAIDLNPVLCTGHRCVIADARIMLSEERWDR